MDKHPIQWDGYLWDDKGLFSAVCLRPQGSESLMPFNGIVPLPASLPQLPELPGITPHKLPAPKSYSRGVLWGTQVRTLP